MSEAAAEMEQREPLNQPSKDDTDTLGIQKVQITVTDLDRPISRISAFIALILQFATIVILIVFSVVPVWIKKPQVSAGTYLSSANRLLYLTGTTILATVVTSFTIAQIRGLWFSLALSKEDAPASGRTLGRARTLIGLASLREQSRHFSITASFLLAGLMTTAIVAGISATDFPLITGTIALLALDHTGYLGGLGGSPLCFGVLNSTRYARSGFTWPLGNGSYIGLNNAIDPNCETQMVLPAFLNAKYTPKGDAYWMGGVPVSPLAAGVPYSIDQGFDFSFGLMGNMYGDQLGLIYPSNSMEFNWVTQCFPVLATNPVTCHQLGKVAINDSAISVAAGGCEISKSFPYRNTTTDPVTAVGICVDTPQNIGSSTIIIGSTGDHAFELADSLGKTDTLDVDSEGRRSLAVVCNIDIASSLGFRLLNFSRTPPLAEIDDDSWVHPHTFATHVTVAANYCTPISPQGPVNLSQFLTPSMLATGGSASWQLLAENDGIDSDGHLATLLNTAINVQPQSGKTFQESQNYLEDSLGQASAIALGLFWGYWQTFQIGGAVLEGLNPLDPDNIGVYIINGNASVEGVRAGTGSRIALLYIIPEVFCAGLLIWLLYCTWHLK